MCVCVWPFPPYSDVNSIQLIIKWKGSILALTEGQQNPGYSERLNYGIFEGVNENGHTHGHGRVTSYKPGFNNSF